MTQAKTAARMTIRATAAIQVMIQTIPEITAAVPTQIQMYPARQ